ncbi:hypothetical protein BXZ70DRAFT_1013196 [Cristinia sonorae]|uniref:Uncharacterized protein n=1 Tax=Cristinia sonorae TaxID=1940300 RepID=A0A8K0UDY1_9AGAR|nr:hypothetical protein BXZ70DRAFT_1013196 [Cristinia sonorae]
MPSVLPRDISLEFQGVHSANNTAYTCLLVFKGKANKQTIRMKAVRNSEKAEDKINKEVHYNTVYKLPPAQDVVVSSEEDIMELQFSLIIDYLMKNLVEIRFFMELNYQRLQKFSAQDWDLASAGSEVCWASMMELFGLFHSFDPFLHFPLALFDAISSFLESTTSFPEEKRLTICRGIERMLTFRDKLAVSYSFFQTFIVALKEEEGPLGVEALCRDSAGVLLIEDEWRAQTSASARAVLLARGQI